MSIEDDILIEKFLRDQLTAEELKIFHTRLKSDEEFKAGFDIEAQLFNSLNEEEWSYAENVDDSEIKDYKNILDSVELQNLKKTLEEVNENYQSQNSFKLYKWIVPLVAASVALFFVFNIFTRSTSSLDLYNEYSDKGDLPSLVIRGESSSNLSKAQQLFENNNYENALTIFESALNNSEDKATLYLYKGISETELEEFAEAEKTFNELINSDLLDASKGYWYKALLFLKMDEEENAKAVLRTIVDNKFYKFRMAKELLGKLD
jgi:hypothetical protein